MSNHPLFDKFHELRGQVLEAQQTPRTVIFNYDSWSRAMTELHATAWITHNPTTYGGLPHCIDPNQAEDIVVTHEPVHVVQAAIRSTPPRSRQSAITLSMKGTFGKLGDPPPTIIEIVAQSLDAATLCDIIRKWLDSDDATHWGEFEKALDKVVTEHGRFE